MKTQNDNSVKNQTATCDNNVLANRLLIHKKMSNKIETSFNIDRLEQGYLITKNDTERIGINNENDLESRISNFLSREADVKNLLYFNNLKNVKIIISVEYSK